MVHFLENTINTKYKHTHTQVQTGCQGESEIEVDFQRKGYFEYKILKGFWGNFSINFFLQAQQKKSKITSFWYFLQTSKISN